MGEELSLKGVSRKTRQSGLGLGPSSKVGVSLLQFGPGYSCFKGLFSSGRCGWGEAVGEGPVIQAIEGNAGPP